MLQVTELEFQSDKVRLGFDVDSNVPAHRLEVRERIPGRDNTLPVSCLGRWQAIKRPVPTRGEPGGNPKVDRANGRRRVENY